MTEPDEEDFTAEAMRKLVKSLKEEGFDRMEMGLHLGVSERTIYRWENGESRIPRMAFIALKLMLQQE